MAAKTPAKKAAPKKARVKSSKAKAKAVYTKAQRKAYTAASRKAVAKAVATQRAAVTKARGIQNAKGVQHRRALNAARSKAKVGRSGKRLKPASGVQAVIRLRSQGAQAAGNARRTQTFTYQQAAFISGLATFVANRKVVARALARGKLKKPAKAVAKKSAAPRRPSRYAAVGARAGAAAAANVPAPKTVAKKSVSKPRKAAGITPSVNSEWITAGNDRDVENCVAVAIANHLLLHSGHRVSNHDLAYLMYRDSVQKALTSLDYNSPWQGVGLSEYGMKAPEDAQPGDIVGFETGQGSHCAVLMPGNMVISWGEIVPLESEVDEVWEVAWTVTSQ